MLAISLHAVRDELRDELVPLNRKYPIAELLAACRAYPGLSNARRITFEYVMLKGVNDSPADARELVRLLAGIPAKINLIPFNPVAGHRLRVLRLGADRALRRHRQPRRLRLADPHAARPRHPRRLRPAEERERAPAHPRAHGARGDDRGVAPDDRLLTRSRRLASGIIGAGWIASGGNILMDWKLELVAVPVSDVDRAKAFYADKIGFNADHDHSCQRSDSLRPADAAGLGLLDRHRQGDHRPRRPARSRACSSSSPMWRRRGRSWPARGLEVGEIQEFPWGRFIFFADPDGNRWAVQQIQPAVAATSSA